MKNNRKTVLIISMVLVMILAISLSYAFFYYRNTLSDISLNNGEITINFNEGTNNLSLNANYPKSDTLGVVGDNYYDFSISGKIIDETINYEIQIKELNGSTLNQEYVKVYLTDQNENALIGPLSLNSLSLNEYNHNRVIYARNLATSSQVDYYRLRVWLDSSYTDSTQKSFNFKVNLYARNNEE